MKSSSRTFKRRRGIAVVTLLFVASAVTVTGLLSRKYHGRQEMEEQLAKEEEKRPFAETQTSQKVSGTAVEKREPMQKIELKEQVNPKPSPKIQTKEQTLPATETANKPDALAFSKEDVLKWPVDGNVLMNYSMDKTIYFSTLDQYKYNPALIIGGEAGTEVVAAARGIVKSVEVTSQTGTTVTMELGNGYEAVYGQLKDVKVKEGKYVDQGEAFAVLSEPTKYYSVEGSNLYFQLLKNGEPVNPMEYLDS